jgi:hypothetical protein
MESIVSSLKVVNKLAKSTKAEGRFDGFGSAVFVVFIFSEYSRLIAGH